MKKQSPGAVPEAFRKNFLRLNPRCYAVFGAAEKFFEKNSKNLLTNHTMYGTIKTTKEKGERFALRK